MASYTSNRNRLPKAKLTKITINELSAVDRPCQEPAVVALMKREGVDVAPLVSKAAWTTADIDGLPDGSFLYVEPGGSKDGDGKTTPRSLRHFPYKTAGGQIDIAHLRNAISRIPQSSLPATVRERLQVRAEKLLAAQHKKVGKAAVRKQAVVTSEVDGHQHTLDLDDPIDGWSDQLQTSYQVAEGATVGHSHAWTYDAAGVVTIAADSGHTHTVGAQVPADVIAAAALEEIDEQQDRAEDIAAQLAVEPDEPTGDIRDVRVTQRARNSTTANANRNVEIMQDTKDTEIATLQKRSTTLAALLAAAIALPEDQHVYIAKLSAEERETFLGKPPADRAADVAKAVAADPPLYTRPDGTVLRKSQGQALADVTKQLDEMQAALAKSRIEGEAARFDKRVADEIPFLKGELPMKAAVLKALDGIADEKLRGEAVAMLKGANAAMGELAKARGYTPLDDANGAVQTPLAKFQTKLGEYAKAVNKTPPNATADFLNTAEGAQLYADFTAGQA